MSGGGRGWRCGRGAVAEHMCMVAYIVLFSCVFRIVCVSVFDVVREGWKMTAVSREEASVDVLVIMLFQRLEQTVIRQSFVSVEMPQMQSSLVFVRPCDHATTSSRSPRYRKQSSWFFSSLWSCSNKYSQSMAPKQ